MYSGSTLNSGGESSCRFLGDLRNRFETDHIENAPLQAPQLIHSQCRLQGIGCIEQFIVNHFSPPVAEEIIAADRISCQLATGSSNDVSSNLSRMI
jgi:hypothetical protein